MPVCIIRNVRLLDKSESGTVTGDVAIRDGVIAEVLRGGAALIRNEAADTEIDGGGGLLIPGMIDVHIHGADGFDMMDGTARSLEAVSAACARTGCTSFLATSVSSSAEDLFGMLDSVARFIGNEAGARVAGVHIEGPYLNTKRKGMQNERYLRHPDLDEMKAILARAGSLIRMVTLAPELPGGLEMVAYLKERGIVVSVAHSDATYEEAKQAFRSGASHVTHCFNGMRPIHHRDPGVVVAAFEEPGVSVQAIVDDVHLHPAIVRLLYREKGADRMVLITDALQAMGMGDGSYLFGGHRVTVTDGVATLADGTLASSTITMNAALAKAVQAGIPLRDAVRMATETPAAVLGLTRKGRLAPGMDADLVLLDERFEVQWTMVDGAVVYRRAESSR
ncbi:N-acetylglucosamine-6-phosphate deacetylase [Paenibacillus sacheonensis]|uniref:N-acetylglucosamine-6-phosphate deacetylase n=1 Tax=Paenibacillus sacheonensis TaxID=742054 RepID=A0A7X4YR78_9BACL|nr:N-acetylglucosamine-6-phosphate deacetylase [Paenibacillus sacheonensis]MBM7565086.1 N-acetylglucosamine-6-phosphate deacetylase [Paenibacillus sacheonensis]NBC70131.1 N-acetylglucosamine-6-phosphate deacetylase [Paenibacillus sacheonensis]